ncbi:hypothetical protein BDW22DRAFT_1425612 [Trametopsis cervina]|nr:hypothetical protein BDW22DRAFT_1425612 [Trametopsis cervina]
MARPKQKASSPQGSDNHTGTSDDDCITPSKRKKRTSTRQRKKTTKQHANDEDALMKELEKLKRENKALKKIAKPAAASTSSSKHASKQVSEHAEESNSEPGSAESEDDDNSSVPHLRSLGLVQVQPRLTTRLGDPKPPHPHHALATQGRSPLLQSIAQPVMLLNDTADHERLPSIRSSSPLSVQHSRTSSPPLSSSPRMEFELPFEDSEPDHISLLSTAAAPNPDHVLDPPPRSQEQRQVFGSRSSSSSQSSQVRLTNTQAHTSTSQQSPPEENTLVIEYKNGVAPVGMKPKEADYSGTTLQILLRALKRFEVKLLTVSAYPNHDTVRIWTRQALTESCRETGNKFPAGEAHERICKLIEARPSTIRGHIKNKIVAKIVEVYGMHTDTTKPGNEEANQRRYDYLVSTVGGEGDPNRYCYKDFDANDPQYLGEHEILLRGLQEWCFKSNTDIGIEHRASFDPINIATIAMLLTMVRYGLDRWASGRLQQGRKDFTEKDYRRIYEGHVTHLKDWEELNPEVFRNIRRKMYRKVLRLANIDLNQSIPAGLSASIKQRAMAQLANRTGETDSE